jgi:hypothetical protein
VDKQKNNPKEEITSSLELKIEQTLNSLDQAKPCKVTTSFTTSVMANIEDYERQNMVFQSGNFSSNLALGLISLLLFLNGFAIAWTNNTRQTEIQSRSTTEAHLINLERSSILDELFLKKR